MSQNRNLTIKQKDLMKYLMGTCISEDSGIKKIFECIPTECSNLSLQVALMIGDGSDDRLTLFEEHVQDVVHSVIDEKTFNSYQGNPDTIVNVKPIEIEENSNAPDTKNNQAKGKKKRFRFKYKKIINIQKNPKKCTSQQQDDECNQVEKVDGRPKGKRKNIKKYTRNIDKASNIIGEKSQNLTCDTGDSYEKEIYLKKILADEKHYVDYEKVYLGSYKGGDEYEDVLEIQHEEEESGSYNDEDYENKIYIQKEITGTTTNVGGDDSEYEDIDIQKDPRERNTHEKDDNDTCIDDDGYLEPTDIHKGRRKMTADTNSESDGYEDINDISKDTSGITTDEEDNISYRDDDEYEDVEGGDDEKGNNDTYREDDGYEDVDEEGNNDTCTDDDGYEDVDVEGNNGTYREDDEYEDVIDIPVVPIGITADEEGSDSNKDDEYLEVTDFLEDSKKDDEYLEVTDFSEDSNKDDEYLEVTEEDDDDAYDYDKIDYQQLNTTNKCSKKDILPKLPPRNTPEEHRIRVKEDLPDNLSEMSCNQVQDCLKLLKLDKHLEKFQRIRVDGELLMDLDPDIMKTELNLTKFEILKLKMFVTEKWLPRV
ncbi:uncharacterized protein [Antedon mediterranea]|uniref:uncharacterized protein n=1 Tax=Antedon mediterranea TaxID=105859 RepID=UPI003AF58EC0